MAQLKAGVAKVGLAPPIGVELAGYAAVTVAEIPDLLPFAPNVGAVLVEHAVEMIGSRC